tara:strand:- start:14705 stop:14893 length:189 start_codon:yes stop_codon:yes gene_type:complete
MSKEKNKTQRALDALGDPPESNNTWDEAWADTLAINKERLADNIYTDSIVGEYFMGPTRCNV